MGSIKISRDEAFAFAVVSAVLGVEVEPYDVTGAPGVVDALLHYFDGRVAALEVSSIGPGAHAELASAIARNRKRTIKGLEKSWHVSVTRTFRAKNLANIGVVLQRCEELGATKLNETNGDVITDQLLGLGVSAWAFDNGDNEPVVWLHLDVLGGFTSIGSTNLTAELDAELASDIMQSKITKLARSGYDERHLFLGVRDTALSFPIYDSLSFGGPLPNDVPQLPGGLSQVWLVSGWKEGGVVRAIAGQGWSRTDPFS